MGTRNQTNCFLHLLINAKSQPGYDVLILEAVLNIKDYHKGASRQAIKNYIEANHKKVSANFALRNALKKAVDSGALLQEGQRFKLPKEKRAELRKPTPKPKKKKVTKVAKKKTKKKTKKTNKKKTKKKTTKKKTTKKKTKPTRKRPRKKQRRK